METTIHFFTVERLDEGILLGLTWVDVVPFDAIVVRPLQDRAAGELCPVARREEELVRGNGHMWSRQIAQRVAISGSQVSTVVLHKPHR